MAYTDIPSGDKDPDSPITTSLINLLDNNLDGVAAGDAGAPEIKVPEALEGYSSLSSHWNFYPASPRVASSLSSTMQKLLELKVGNAGTVSVQFSIKSTYGGAAVGGRIYIGGVATGTDRTVTSTSYTTYTEDITVAAGDLVQIYGHGDNTIAQAHISGFGIGLNELNGILGGLAFKESAS